MRLLIFFLLCCLAGSAQETTEFLIAQPSDNPEFPINSALIQQEKIKISPGKWKLTSNRRLSGGLVMLAGASKGFNETLMFHWKEFRRQFPGVNPMWFNPADSWRNKYKNGDPKAGAKFPLSTTALVMFTDQYHINTFINRMAWTSALVINIGDGKKPLKHYLMDFIYYSLCHQAGFALTYYPFQKYRGK